MGQIRVKFTTVNLGFNRPLNPRSRRVHSVVRGGGLPPNHRRCCCCRGGWGNGEVEASPCGEGWGEEGDRDGGGGEEGYDTDQSRHGSRMSRAKKPKLGAQGGPILPPKLPPASPSAPLREHLKDTQAQLKARIVERAQGECDGTESCRGHGEGRACKVGGRAKRKRQ